MENKQTKAQWRFDEIMWWKPRIIKPMENKQTAVEWLNQQIVDRQNGNGNSKSWDEILEQALAMEKEQIMDDFQEGKWDWHAKLNEGKESKDPAEYYNETYGK
jgi:hypothetical protein